MELAEMKRTHTTSGLKPTYNNSSFPHFVCEYWFVSTPSSSSKWNYLQVAALCNVHEHRTRVVDKHDQKSTLLSWCYEHLSVSGGV